MIRVLILRNFMWTKFIITILITISLLGGFAYLNLVYLNKSATQTKLDKKIPAKSTQNASFALMPSTLISTSSQSAILDVIIESNAAPATQKTVQLELSYDPTLIYNLDIFPGDYFVNPEIILSHIDYKNGRVSYALRGTTQSTNSVARITFNTNNYGLAKETKITFLPKTLIRIDGEEVKIGSLNDATIISKPAFFPYIPLATPSAQISP